MAYKVPDLKYPYDALEPHIDEATMRLHHDKHHQAYVDKANAALAGTQWEDVRPKEMLVRLDELPDDLRTTVRNNAGGQYNHCMLWRSLSPDGGGEPTGALADAISEAFGSFENLKAELKDAGVNQFGSGWAWLVHDNSGLAVVSTPNQDNPITNGITPLLGVDVWEHAYYLRYQNRRPDYIDAFFNVVDWAIVAERYAEVATSNVTPDPAPVEEVPEGAAAGGGEAQAAETEDPLTRPVHVNGTNKRFGEVTRADAQAQALELKGLAGWGPTARVAAVGREWAALAVLMKERGLGTVSELEADEVAHWAVRLWVVLPKENVLFGG